MLIRKFFTKLKDIYLYIYLFLFKKILFTDKYGLSYYLYKNIRPIDTFRRGVRTDDTTVLVTVRELLQNNLHLKNIHCVDVGSFIGIVTLMMAKTLTNSKNKWTIHSFEPFKDTFSKLKENIEIIYKNENIKINNMAVSNKSGSQQMLTSDKAPGTNKLLSGPNEFQETQNGVKITTLDEYLNKKNIDQILICKIDAEGVDDLVLKGMSSFLKKMSVDYLILEYEDKLSQEKISEILQEYNYKIYYMVRNKNYLVEKIDDYPKNEQSLINILAISPIAKISPFEKLIK